MRIQFVPHIGQLFDRPTSENCVTEQQQFTARIAIGHTTTVCGHNAEYEGWNFNSGNYLFAADTK